MNTDNMSIAGETIDYGPCAFMDAYDPATVFSSIDTQGRYAYANQPRIAPWNLARFGETLLPLLADDSEAAPVPSPTRCWRPSSRAMPAALLSGLRRKLGLFTEQEGDAALAEDLLKAMAANQADFTLTFRRLGEAAADAAAGHRRARPVRRSRRLRCLGGALAPAPGDRIAGRRRAPCRDACRRTPSTFRATIWSRRCWPLPSSATTTRRSRR